jgi:hypothetical protein
LRSVAVALSLAVILGIIGVLIVRTYHPPQKTDCVGRLQYVQQFGERYTGELKHVQQDCRH